jgi:hypothetical protein
MINYLIATWAGDKRRNPSTEYLKVHLGKLFSLQHNVRVTVIRPLGSDCDEFYNLPADILNKVTILNRPANDRSYGQFLYAFDKVPKSDYFILAEDDYIPVLDNFDTILKDILEEKGADYICGRYHTQSRLDPLHPEMNIGIVKASSLQEISKQDVKFPANGTDDGSEKVIFAKMFTDQGLRIDDYSDRYSVPYWDRYLRYLTPNKGQAMFEPYQMFAGRAFTYEWDLADSEADLNSHFLMDIDLHGNDIYIDGVRAGRYYESGDSFDVHVSKYQKQVGDRLRYINRYREIQIKFA